MNWRNEERERERRAADRKALVELQRIERVAQAVAIKARWDREAMDRQQRFNRGIWGLLDVRHLALARKNFNITHSEAMRQNLLGALAGDVAFKLVEGAGVHLEIAKEELIETTPTEDGYNEVWQMRISGVSFTGRGGEVRTDLHAETTQLFATWDLEASEEHCHASYCSS